jgi:HD-like signal output (HDOD) protein
MLVAVVVVVVLVVVFVLWRSRARHPDEPQRPAPAAPAARTLPVDRAVASTAAPATAAVMAAEPTSWMDDGQLVRHESLSDAQRAPLLRDLQQLPRPPRALQQLVSPEFLARASSNELADLVMTEPVVAARVLAAVNAPAYGLHRAVSSVGQAITFLGLNSVRNLCLQHLLREGITTTDRVLQQEFDVLWRASAIASELCLTLAKRLELPDAAGMSTQLVLHFIGRLGAASMLRAQPGAASAAPMPTATQERALAEQQRLGLSSGELGALLLQDWNLPPAVVAGTRDIARVPFLLPPAPESAGRAVLCALCASLAERLARRELTAVQDYAFERDTHPDRQWLRPLLAAPLQQSIGEALRDPDLARVL